MCWKDCVNASCTKKDQKKTVYVMKFTSMHVIKRWHQSMYQEDDIDAYDKEVDISVCTKEVNISAQGWLSSMNGKASQGAVYYGQIA